MAAYVIVDVEVLNPVPYEEYRARVPATLEPYGGRFIVRGGEYKTIEGKWEPQRIVVLEFPSMEQAGAWYESPEYQEVISIREEHARTHFLTLVEGV